MSGRPCSAFCSALTVEMPPNPPPNTRMLLRALLHIAVTPEACEVTYSERTAPLSVEHLDLNVFIVSKVASHGFAHMIVSCAQVHPALNRGHDTHHRASGRGPSTQPLRAKAMEPQDKYRLQPT